MSARARVQLQPAYLLHHFPYRDSSRILEMLTRDRGRVGLVARGARRPASRWRGVLQAFRPLLVSWTGRGDLGTLTAAEARASAGLPRGDTLMSAYYLNELLLRLLARHDAHPELYGLYEKTLQSLCGSGEPGRVLRIFEKRLLAELGYGLNLSHDSVSERPLDPDCLYEYRLEHGPVPAASAAPGQLCFSGGSLLSLDREELADATSRRDARRLLRAALELYLGDRPLKSRQVMRSMRRRESSADATRKPS